MSRPASPYGLSRSMASPRPSSSRSNRGPVKAFRSASPALSAMKNVQMSQHITADKPKKKDVKRPINLPSAESLYDELLVSKKEIKTQQKIIDAQKTRNTRLEEDLKKREEQMELILNGNNGKETSTKNDQLRSRIIRLERELRNKDLNLSKLQFDLKTTDVNELKLALNIYSDELTRLRLLKDDQLAQTSNKIQAERKMQISQLKNALTKLAKEREVLAFENEKYKSQLDDLRSNKLQSQLKMKNENGYLKDQLRKTRKIEGVNGNADIKLNGSDTKLIQLERENKHLKTKIDKMGEELENFEHKSQIESKSDDQKLKNDFEKLEAEKDEQIALCKNLNNQLTRYENEIRMLETKLSKYSSPNQNNFESVGQAQPQTQASSARSRRRTGTNSSAASQKSSPNEMGTKDDSTIIGAIQSHIHRVDLISA